MEIIRDLLYSSVYHDNREILKLRKKLFAVPGKHLIFKGRKGKTYQHGSFRYGGKLCSVHTLWWRLSGRELPKGYYLKNTCKNESCINCDHLKLTRYGRKK